MSDAVKLHRDGPVLEITLDRPKANAINLATSQALHAAFRLLQDDEALRVAILTAAGERIFSAGWDLKAAASGAETPDTDYGPGGFAGLTTFFALDKPVIGAINGAAIAGGFELALACDMLVAAEHASFGLSEVAVGIVADSGGVQRLPRRLPRAIAAELLMTGRRMGAAEALAHGLVNAVVPKEALMPRARALAADVARNAPLAVRAVKAILTETDGMSLPDAFAHVRGGHVAAHRRMLASDDAREGSIAFVEKRDPVWKGR